MGDRPAKKGVRPLLGRPSAWMGLGELFEGVALRWFLVVNVFEDLLHHHIEKGNAVPDPDGSRFRFAAKSTFRFESRSTKRDRFTTPLYRFIDHRKK